MDFIPQISKRVSQLNRVSSVVVEPVHVMSDGHGTYLVKAHLRKGRVCQQLFVNPAEAKTLSAGKTNPNLDSQLRL
jgi:hypothetical protein